MKKYFVIFLVLTAWIPFAFADVVIQNDKFYVGDDGSLHIVGEIQNDLKSPLNQVKVLAILYDSNGNIIESKETSTLVNTIMPTMKGPFDLIFTNINPYSVNYYSLDFNYSIGEPKGQVIDISSSELKKDSHNNLIISGVVENNGELTANTVAVITTLYDKDGNVVSVSRTHPEPDYLGSDDDVFFIVSVMDKNQIPEIVDYSVVAESEEYAAAPEFPIGSMILLAVSVSTYLVITRYSSKIIANLISAANPK